MARKKNNQGPLFLRNIFVIFFLCVIGWMVVAHVLREVKPDRFNPSVSYGLESIFRNNDTISSAFALVNSSISIRTIRAFTEVVESHVSVRSPSPAASFASEPLSGVASAMSTSQRPSLVTASSPAPETGTRVASTDPFSLRSLESRVSVLATNSGREDPSPLSQQDTETLGGRLDTQELPPPSSSMTDRGAAAILADVAATNSLLHSWGVALLKSDGGVKISNGQGNTHSCVDCDGCRLNDVCYDTTAIEKVENAISDTNDVNFVAMRTRYCSLLNGVWCKPHVKQESLQPKAVNPKQAQKRQPAPKHQITKKASAPTKDYIEDGTLPSWWGESEIYWEKHGRPTHIYFAILGMFDSGTNLLYDIITLNFPLCRPKLAKHKDYLTTRRPRIYSYCLHMMGMNKHLNPRLLENIIAGRTEKDFNASRQEFAERRNITLFAMVREPLPQFLSWKKDGYDLRTCSRKQSCVSGTKLANVPECSDSPWLTSPCKFRSVTDNKLEQGNGVIGGSFSSLVDVWNQYGLGYVSLKASGAYKAVEVVKYEELVVNQTDVVDRIADALGFERPRNVAFADKPAKAHGQAASRAVASKRVSTKSWHLDFGTCEIKAVCSLIDRSTLLRLGYDADDCENIYLQGTNRACGPGKRAVPARESRQPVKAPQKAKQSGEARPEVQAQPPTKAPQIIQRQSLEMRQTVEMQPREKVQKQPSEAQQKMQRQRVPSQPALKIPRVGGPKPLALTRPRRVSK